MRHGPIFLTMFAALLVGFVLTATGADNANQTRLVAKLTKIDGQSLTLTSDSGTTVTVTCNDATKFRRDAAPSTPTSLADLQVNQTLRVYYGPDNVASLVNITDNGGSTQPATQQTRLVGQLTTIDGKNLTITPESSAAVTITCKDSTKYRRDAAPNTPTSFSDLKVKQTVRVYYTSDKTAGLVNIVKEP